jgi:hypothetical protein
LEKVCRRAEEMGRVGFGSPGGFARAVWWSWILVGVVGIYLRR